MKNGKAKVLVVDDEEAMRKLISRMLKGKYTVLEAADGSQAIEQTLEHNPSVILMDMFMPNMDGCTACLRINNDAATRNIPVIAITGNGGPLQEQLVLSLGATKFVSKPFSEKDLLSAIEEAINNNRAVFSG